MDQKSVQFPGDVSSMVTASFEEVLATYSEMKTSIAFKDWLDIKKNTLLYLQDLFNSNSHLNSTVKKHISNFVKDAVVTAFSLAAQKKGLTIQLNEHQKTIARKFIDKLEPKKKRGSSVYQTQTKKQKHSDFSGSERKHSGSSKRKQPDSSDLTLSDLNNQFSQLKLTKLETDTLKGCLDYFKQNNLAVYKDILGRQEKPIPLLLKQYLNSIQSKYGLSITTDNSMEVNCKTLFNLYKSHPDYFTQQQFAN